MADLSNHKGDVAIDDALRELLIQRIKRDFTYHAPKPGQAERYTQIREKAKEFALLIANTTPASREQSLALTELDKSVFFANAAIARNE